MKRRIVLGVTALAAAGIAIPVANATIQPPQPPPHLPPACVVVNGPDGTVQVGYAPHGWDDCVQLPPA